LLLRQKQPAAIWLGASKLEYSKDGVQISSRTLRDSTLYNAGLDDGDRILRWQNKSINDAAALQNWLAKRTVGERVSLRVRQRSGVEKTVEVVLVADPSLELVTYESAHMPVTPEMSQLRAAWLSSKAIHPLPKIPVMP
jgi:S1-C subfamily serine protease